MEEIKKTENNLEKEHGKAVDYKDAPVEPKNNKVDTYSYKGWLNSDSFLKRAFAVVGYQFAASLIFYAVILGMALVFGLLGFIFSLIFG